MAALYRFFACLFILCNPVWCAFVYSASSDIDTRIGRIPGNFSINASGGAVYTVPIECPSAPSALQPHLSLTYNSQGGNGIAGWGWSLSGLSAISRAPKISYYDGTDKDIVWDKSDALTLDGQRLFVVAEYGTDSVEYRTESDPALKIVGYNVQSWGVSYFKVYTKSRVVYTYGNPDEITTYTPVYRDVKTRTQSGRLAWNLVEAVDAFGNYMRFHYNESLSLNGSGHVLQKIVYGLHKTGEQTTELSVHFGYISRPDDILAFCGGKGILQQQRLSTIRTMVGNALRHEYRLLYTQSHISRLSSIELYEGNVKIYDPLVFSYGGDDQIGTKTDISFIKTRSDGTDKKRTGLIAVDLEGDGYPELGDLYIHNSTIGENFGFSQMLFDIHCYDKDWIATHNFPVSYGMGVVLNTTTVPTFKTLVEGLISQFADFDGDGSSESVSFYKESGLFNLKITSRKDHAKGEDRVLFDSPLELCSDLPFVTVGHFTPYPLAGVLVIYNDPQKVSNGYKYKYQIIQSSTNGLIPVPQTVHEFIVPRKISSVSLYQFRDIGSMNDLWLVLDNNSAYVLKNTGWVSNGCFTSSADPLLVLPSGSAKTYTFGDLNRDGLQDILFRKDDVWFVTYNKGNYIFDQSEKLLNIQCTAHSGDNDQIMVLDFNRDGMPDIIVGDEAISGNSTTWRFYRNDGNNGFSLWRTVQSPTRAAYSAFGDLNRNGSLCWAYEAVDGKVYIEDFGFRYSGLLTGITDPINGTSTIVYKPQTEYSFKESETERKNYMQSHQCLIYRQSQIPVVAEYREGRNQIEYDYGTLLYNWPCRGLLGFRNRSEHNQTTGTWTILENKLYNASNYYLFLPVSIRIQTSPKETLYSNRISIRNNTYTIRPIEGKRYALQLQKETLTDYLNGLSRSTSYTYDDYNNPISTVLKSGLYTRTVSSSFAAQAAWCPNAVVSSSIREEYQGTDRYDYTISYTYGEKGQLTNKTPSAGIVEAYADWDIYGHPMTVTRSDGNMSLVERCKYSPSGRFLLERVDATGNKQSCTWDEIREVLLTETDYIGTTVYSYNRLGELASIVYPDGKKETYRQMKEAGTDDTKVAYSMLTQTTGESPVWVGYNRYGQELERYIYGPHQKIYSYRRYDEKGRIERISKPISGLPGSNSWAKIYTYDAKNRVETLQTPLGTTVYEYGDQWKRITTPSGIREEEWDVNGYPVRSTVNGKNVYYTNTVGGRTIKYEAEGTAKSNVSYNRTGEYVSYMLPDTEMVPFKKNHLGKVIYKDNVAYEYNENGLLIKKSFSSGSPASISYEYDEHARLKRMATSDNYSISYEYDELDRVLTRTDHTGNGKNMVTAYEYDSCGRVWKYVYPSGYYILNEYDSYGYLVKVTDGAGRKIWELVSTYADGKVKQERKGNRTITSGYDEAGRLRVCASDASAMGYMYDKVTGNLISRKDGLAQQKDTFIYDELDRLKRWGNGGQSTSIEYDGKGNIFRKGDYDFMYGGQPEHALQNILGRYNREEMRPEEAVTYNDFRKVNTYEYGINGTRYYYSYQYTFFYGPDEQRMRVQHMRNWQYPYVRENRYYAPNYEEEDYDTKRKIHYIYGGNGLAAVCIIDNTGTNVYQAYTDYQGSLLALAVDSGVVERYAYDPWGRRRNPADWSKWDERTTNKKLSPYLVDRGYTLHEHIPGTNIINMNGRLYDALTSTFLSCDPYIQDPGNWLNYLPYSYCMNNPMKYTDPSGEVWWMLPALAAATFGGTNLLSRAIHGGINSIGDVFYSFGQGAIAGFTLGTVYQLSGYIPGIGGALQKWMGGYALGQAMTVGVGVIAGTLTNGLEGLGHSLEISLGNFNLDENSFWGGVLQGISRHTWESPQTIIGHAYSHWRNSMGNVDRVDFLGGATFVTQENAGGNGVTFGNFININNYEKIKGDFAAYVIGQERPLYMHEYGHTIDSRLFGPLYLPVIGVPSASNVKNKRYWTELRANQAAFRYFGKYYELKNWNDLYCPRY